MRILLTGAGGQVGNKLLPLLRPLGEVLATDAPGGTFAPLDLADPASIASVVRAFRPTLIVNPAAYTAVDKAETDTALATKVNATAPGLLGEEAKRLGAALVHYSTDYVFDGTGTRPWREDDPVGPLGIYGKTKLDGERALQASGCRHVIFRTSWVFSDHGANFVKTMLRFGAERETLRVVADQTGTPTSAAFLARMTLAAVEKTEGRFENLGGLYHLVCGGETTWHGFAEAIFAKARARGMKLAVKEVEAIPTSSYPTPAKRPANSRMDCRKFTTTFGETQQPWSAALDEVLAALVV